MGEVFKNKTVTESFWGKFENPIQKWYHANLTLKWIPSACFSWRWKESKIILTEVTTSLRQCCVPTSLSYCARLYFIIYSRLSRCSTARGSSRGSSLGGLVKVKAKVKFFKVVNVYWVLFIFTNVNLKKGPAMTFSASYSMGSCPLAIVIAIP